jgi:hypothetical protein
MLTVTGLPPEEVISLNKQFHDAPMLWNSSMEHLEDLMAHISISITPLPHRLWLVGSSCGGGGCDLAARVASRP